MRLKRNIFLVDIYGYSWIVNGNPWKFMDIHEKKCCVLTSWTFMDVNEVPWISMDFHGPFRLGGWAWHATIYTTLNLGGGLEGVLWKLSSLRKKSDFLKMLTRPPPIINVKPLSDTWQTLGRHSVDTQLRPSRWVLGSFTYIVTFPLIIEMAYLNRI